MNELDAPEMTTLERLALRGAQLAGAVALALMVLGSAAFVVLALPVLPWQGQISLPILVVAFWAVMGRAVAERRHLTLTGCLLFAFVPALASLYLGGAEFVLNIMPWIDGFILVTTFAIALLFLLNGLRQGGFSLLVLGLVLVGLALSSWSQHRIVNANVEYQAVQATVAKSQAAIAEAESAMAERQSEVGGKIFAEQTSDDAVDWESMSEAEAAAMREKLKDAEEAKKELEALKAAGKIPGESYSFRDRQVEREASAPVDGDDDIDYGGLGEEVEEEATIELGGLTYTELEAFQARAYADYQSVFAKFVVFLTVMLVGLHYLRQLNWTFPRQQPLPIAGRWLDALFAKEARVYLQTDDAASLRQFLQICVSKGESFICFADRPVIEDRYLPVWNVAGVGIPLVGRLPHMTDGNPRFIDDSDFVFESAWFGRYAFTICDDDRCRALLLDIEAALRLRRETGAVARHTLNLVWARQEALPAALFESLSFIAAAANIRLVLFSPADPDEAIEDHLDGHYDQDFFAAATD